MTIYEDFVSCPKCGGDGKIDIHRPLIVGVPPSPDIPPVDMTDECRLCRGTGWILDDYYEGATDIDWIKKKIKKILNKLEIPED